MKSTNVWYEMLTLEITICLWMMHTDRTESLPIKQKTGWIASCLGNVRFNRIGFYMPSGVKINIFVGIMTWFPYQTLLGFSICVIRARQATSKSFVVMHHQWDLTLIKPLQSVMSAFMSLFGRCETMRLKECVPNFKWKKSYRKSTVLWSVYNSTV